MQAGILPTIVLLLGPLGILADDTAQDVAIVVCLVELAITGLAVARAAGLRAILVLASGALSLCLGLVVILLKTVVH